MLTAPLRLLNGLRPSVPTGVLVATAVSTVVFTATPFIVPAVAAERHVDVGRVGLISTMQLIGFVLASWGIPRLMHPRRRVMVAASVLGVAANLLSAVAPSFGWLMVTRVLSGVSLGLLAWIAWAQAFGDDERVGDVAVIGPVIGTVASPVLAIVIARSGANAVYVLLAVLNLLPLLFIRSTRLKEIERPVTDRHRPTRAAAAILVSLLLLTLGGSSAFIFAASIGLQIGGMTPLLVSLAFSANAIAGVPSARFRGRRVLPGVWILAIAVSVIAVILWHQWIAFFAAMIVWGFAYWMAVPGAFALLAERSRYPDERAGDAQAVMAVGRVFGPIVGGVLYDASVISLAFVASGILAVSGLVLIYVEWRVRPFPMPELRRVGRHTIAKT